VENAIRPTCIGKKNWIFIGHPDAGWRSAVIYSLLITARRYGLDPARMVDRRAASDPLLHPGQLGRVAALELEAAGGLSPDCASER
jgi:hypothetical protein